MQYGESFPYRRTGPNLCLVVFAHRSPRRVRPSEWNSGGDNATSHSGDAVRVVQQSDGPPGAVALARAVHIVGASVVLLTERPNNEVVSACMEAAFARTTETLFGVPKRKIPSSLRAWQGGTRHEASSGATLLFGNAGNIRLEVFPNGEHWRPTDDRRLSALLREAVASAKPAHVVAVQRLGPGGDGRCRSIHGAVITPKALAPLHRLVQWVFEDKCSGVRTTGIGSSGNEVGMGAVLSAVRATVPRGSNIACTIPSHNLIACSVSNWGAYALAAAVAILAIDKGDCGDDVCTFIDKVIGTEAEILAVLEAAVEAGACDGATGVRQSRSVEGLPFTKSLEVFRSLRRVVVKFANEE